MHGNSQRVVRKHALDGNQARIELRATGDRECSVLPYLLVINSMILFASSGLRRQCSVCFTAFLGQFFAQFTNGAIAFHDGVIITEIVAVAVFAALQKQLGTRGEHTCEVPGLVASDCYNASDISKVH